MNFSGAGCRARWRAVAVVLCTAASAALRAETTLPVPTELGSNITIKVASPVTSVPHFGFLPVRVSVENLTTHDGVWRFRFEAGSRGTFPGLASTAFEVAVPSPQTREVWLYVPMIEAGLVQLSPSLMAQMIPTVVGSRGPPNIDTVYPGSPPGVAAPTMRSSTSVRAASTGLAVPITTFTITQTGPAAALPQMPATKLPGNATQTVTAPDPAGKVTRVTTVSVEQPTLAASAAGMSPQTQVMMNARQKLDTAGLAPAAASMRTSGRSGPGAEYVITISQTGPDTLLPPVDAKKLPSGFISVSVAPAGPGQVTREFVYSENIVTPPPSPTNPAFVPTALSSPATADAEARKILAPTGLLTVPRGVTTNTGRNSVPVPTMTGPSLNTTTVPVMIFEQTGPTGDLPLPRAGSLPPSVTVTLHPGPTPGTSVRVIAVVEPSATAALRAAVTAGNTTSAGSLARNYVGRLELLKLGYIRPSPNISQSSGQRYSSGTPGPGGPDLYIFSESGPSNLLPMPAPGALPNWITCTITPGVLPGEVSRNFIININTMAGNVAASAATAAGSSPSAVAAARAAAAARASSNPMVPPTNLVIEVSGPGIAGGSARVSFPSQAPSPLPPIAIASGLEPMVRARISAAGLRVGLNAATVEPTQLPADWRIWSSFNSVIMKAEEFAALDAGRRAALRGWVALGGRLSLSPDAAGEARTEPTGAGRIDTLAEPVDTLDGRALLDALEIEKLTPAIPNRDNARFPLGTPMSDMVRFEPASILWISLFLVAFAILIGPVNLYFLAAAKSRHRLFFTTPLISLAGAAAVAAAIVLQDGLGGEGVRRALVVLLPGENQAAVFQEQTTHTGFLTKRDFTLEEGVLSAILPTEEVGFGALAVPAAFNRERSAAAGDWFRNRSRQAHLLRAVAPTRARVELVETTPAGAPVVESTLATELKNFRLRDANGAFWTAASVGPGRRVTLQAEAPSPTKKEPPSVGPELQAATEELANLRTRYKDAHPSVQQQLRRIADLSASVAPREGFSTLGTPNLGDAVAAATLRGAWSWTAQGGATDLAPIKTLAAIRWSDDVVLYAGVAERGVGEKSNPSAAATAVEKGVQ